jgi:hypothetical protein
MTNNIRCREVPRGLGFEAKDRTDFQRYGVLGGPGAVCQLIDSGQFVRGRPWIVRRISREPPLR